MKVKIISTALVLLICAAFCLCSVSLVYSTLDETELLSMLVLEHAEAGDMQKALETLSVLAQKWQQRQQLMEMVTTHDDLHEVAKQYTQAATSLENADIPDFKRSMALLREALDHLREHESLSLSNLL